MSLLSINSMLVAQNYEQLQKPKEPGVIFI